MIWIFSSTLPYHYPCAEFLWAPFHCFSFASPHPRMIYFLLLSLFCVSHLHPLMVPQEFVMIVCSHVTPPYKMHYLKSLSLPLSSTGQCASPVLLRQLWSKEKPEQVGSTVPFDLGSPPKSGRLLQCHPPASLATGDEISDLVSIPMWILALVYRAINRQLIIY